MKLKYFLFTVLIFGHAIIAIAKKDKANVKLVEAFSQRTLPGIPGGQVGSNTYIIIVWNNIKTPETFFWQGNDDLQPCGFAKAHKITSHMRGGPAGIAYTTERANPTQIHKGDTLQLTTVRGAKFQVPADIPKNAKNTLFYKTTGSKWISLPVSNIGRKPDIAMP